MKRRPAALGILATLCLASPAAARAQQATDSAPTITLAEALRRSASLDPNYVRALGQIDNAAWARRAARLAFFLPTVSVGLNETKSTGGIFNPADPTARPPKTLVGARADASYEVFSLRKLATVSRTAADLDAAEAGELQQRFATALLTESDYYDVLNSGELLRVVQGRVRRATSALEVARARVVAGAAVQTDSLQLVLELTRARRDEVQLGAAFRVARLQLGRRVGAPGPVDAAPLDSLLPDTLPIALDAAVATALAQGPLLQSFRAQERAADATLRAQRTDYFPQLMLTGSHQRYDTRVFPDFAKISSVTLGLSLPLWNNGQREIAATQARVNLEVARAQRADLELGTRRDVTRAYEDFTTARATIDLATVGVTVARENYRVQQIRYRSGATTIIEFLDAQLQLTQAEADLVQARYAVRRAQSGLEAILGRRLSTNKDAQ